MKTKKWILLILAMTLIIASVLVLTACQEVSDQTPDTPLETVGKFTGLVASRKEQTFESHERTSVAPLSISSIASFSSPFATFHNVASLGVGNRYGCTTAEQNAQFTNKNGTPYFAIERKYFYLIARFEISEDYDIRSITVNDKRYQQGQEDENGVTLLSFYRKDDDWTTHAYLQFAIFAGERGVYEYEIGDVRCYRVGDNAQVAAFTVDYKDEKTVKVDVRGYHDVEFVGQGEPVVLPFLDEQRVEAPEFLISNDGYRETEVWYLNDEEVDLDELKSIPGLRLVAEFELIEYNVYYHIPDFVANALPPYSTPLLRAFDEDIDGYVDELTLCFTFTVESGFEPEFDLENLFATPEYIRNGTYYAEYLNKRNVDVYTYVEVPDFLRWVIGDAEVFSPNYSPNYAYPNGNIAKAHAEDVHFWAVFEDQRSATMGVDYHILVNGEIFIDPDPKNIDNKPALFLTESEAQSYIELHHLVGVIEVERTPNLLPEWLWIDGVPTYGNPVWP